MLGSNPAIGSNTDMAELVRQPSQTNTSTDKITINDSNQTLKFQKKDNEVSRRICSERRNRK